jgi:hypothetical protein
MMDEKKMLTQFTREMMGSSVAHMTDEQLDNWMEPFRKAAASCLLDVSPPLWWTKRRDEARASLLAVLRARR